MRYDEVTYEYKKLTQVPCIIMFELCMYTRKLDNIISAVVVSAVARMTCI